MQYGYIKLWRKSLDAGWLQNPKLWTFWCWCLMKATHREYDQIVGCQQVHLMPGEFVFGRKKASKELRMSEQSIRTFIDFLKTSQNLTIKTTNKFSVISIINWNTYQGNEFENNQQINQPLTNKSEKINQQLTNKQPTKDSEIVDKTTYNLLELLENNEKSTDKSEKINHKQEYKNKRTKEYTSDFLKFYDAYPKHKGKEQAWKTWQKLNGTMPTVDDLILKIQEQSKSEQWTKDDGKYIPHPSTWLNDKRWEDEGVKIKKESSW